MGWWIAIGHLHRPQDTTELVAYWRRYYYNRPQDVFGPEQHISPGIFSEIYNNTMNGIGNVKFENTVDGTGIVLVEEA